MKNQIKRIENYNQIASFLWLDVESNVLKIRIWDLFKIIDSDIVIEIKLTIKVVMREILLSVVVQLMI